MSSDRLSNGTFRSRVLGAGAAAALAVMPAAANAQNEVCLPLKEINGITLSAPASAKLHSKENPGTISIPALPGPDLGTAPSSLTSLFRNNGTEADCFINDSFFPENGSELSLYVAGSAIEYNGQTRFGIQELRDNPEILKTAQLTAEIAKRAYDNK